MGEGRELLHLNGHAEALTAHFRYQGMVGLLGFDASFVERCSTCAGETPIPGGKPDREARPRRYGQSEVPLFQCPRCRKRYSARRATALWDVRIPEIDYCRVAQALAEGIGIRTTSRLFDLDKDTVLRCAWTAGLQCRFVDSLLVRHLHLEECQLDEMWSFVYKKEHHLEPFEALREDLGDVWLHVAFEARQKVLVAVVPGKRTLDNLRRLTHSVRSKSDGAVPLFTTDDYEAYLDALLWEYGQAMEVDRHGLVGRPGDYSYLIPGPHLKHARVRKVREGGRVRSIDRTVCIGSPREVQQILDASPCSRTINTSFVERSHLHQRLNNRRLSRKTLGFSKTFHMHEAQLALSTGYYHFVRPHSSLRITTPNGQPSTPVTPAMRAGITDHVWSMRELLTFPNCYNT